MYNNLFYPSKFNLNMSIEVSIDDRMMEGKKKRERMLTDLQDCRVLTISHTLKLRFKRFKMFWKVNTQIYNFRILFFCKFWLHLGFNAQTQIVLTDSKIQIVKSTPPMDMNFHEEKREATLF